MSHKLPSTIHPGIVRAAGITPESHTLTERLLETDRVIHHCLFNNGIFHNHLSHQFSDHIPIFVLRLTGIFST